MTDFGFRIQADRQIDYDKTDKRIMLYIRLYEPTFDLCISCGSCTSTCSAAGFTDFSFRKIQILIRRGDTAGIASEIKKCMLCGKCQLVCPRNINTRKVIMLIRKATEAGL